MRLNIFVFGKLKSPGAEDLVDHYSRLIRPWVKLSIIEIKALPVTEKQGAARKQIQEKEGLLLLEKMKIAEGGRKILLDELGQSLSTAEWVKKFKNFELKSVSSVSFCIGSSLGFSEEIRKKADFTISLGPQTLSHELARIVLLEQLYRVYSVLKGHPYHNSGT